MPYSTKCSTPLSNFEANQVQHYTCASYTYKSVEVLHICGRTTRKIHWTRQVHLCALLTILSLWYGSLIFVALFFRLTWALLISFLCCFSFVPWFECNISGVSVVVSFPILEPAEVVCFLLSIARCFLNLWVLHSNLMLPFWPGPLLPGRCPGASCCDCQPLPSDITRNTEPTFSISVSPVTSLLSIYSFVWSVLSLSCFVFLLFSNLALCVNPAFQYVKIKGNFIISLY